MNHCELIVDEKNPAAPGMCEALQIIGIFTISSGERRNSEASTVS